MKTVNIEKRKRDTIIQGARDYAKEQADKKVPYIIGCDILSLNNDYKYRMTYEDRCYMQELLTYYTYLKIYNIRHLFRYIYELFDENEFSRLLNAHGNTGLFILDSVYDRLFDEYEKNKLK